MHGGINHFVEQFGLIREHPEYGAAGSGGLGSLLDKVFDQLIERAVACLGQLTSAREIRL
jgi:hypothetical protein